MSQAVTGGHGWMSRAESSWVKLSQAESSLKEVCSQESGLQPFSLFACRVHHHYSLSRLSKESEGMTLCVHQDWPAVIQTEMTPIGLQGPSSRESDGECCKRAMKNSSEPLSNVEPLQLPMPLWKFHQYQQNQSISRHFNERNKLGQQRTGWADFHHVFWACLASHSVIRASLGLVGGQACFGCSMFLTVNISVFTMFARKWEVSRRNLCRHLHMFTVIVAKSQ